MLPGQASGAWNICHNRRKSLRSLTILVSLVYSFPRDPCLSDFEGPKVFDIRLLEWLVKHHPIRKCSFLYHASSAFHEAAVGGALTEPSHRLIKAQGLFDIPAVGLIVRAAPLERRELVLVRGGRRGTLFLERQAKRVAGRWNRGVLVKRVARNMKILTVCGFLLVTAA